MLEKAFLLEYLLKLGHDHAARVRQLEDSHGLLLVRAKLEAELLLGMRC